MEHEWKWSINSNDKMVKWQQTMMAKRQQMAMMMVNGTANGMTENGGKTATTKQWEMAAK